ncbi:MAG: RluA family pseudouridine synthase [Deltaproteobacteria bacterium]|nr:RluA family pseudouridine synthase [Deltaproteobacteria bacterium]
MVEAEGLESQSYTVRFVVEQNYRGWRLDRYLCAKIRRLSRAKAQAIIKAGGLAARPLKPATLVTPGMVLSLVRRREPEPQTPRELPVIYRDADLLVVDKPAGLPMHPTARYHTGTLVALARALAKEGEKPDPAHRLDRETSGLVLCGLTPARTRSLKLAFAAGRVQKAYLAVTEGAPEEEEFEVDLPLSVGGETVRIRVKGDPVHGKPSVTRFRVLARHEIRGERFALVRCEPLTGRQHQIRAHLSAKGFPLVGDKIYGRDERIFVRFTEHALSDDDWRTLRLPRHALHAAEITFPHPADRRTMRLSSPLPPDLVGFLEGEGERSA